MGRKLSSKTQRTSRSKFTQFHLSNGLVSVEAVHDSDVLFFCRKDHEEVDFEVNEVYAVDVLISTGEGKVRGKLMQVLFLKGENKKTNKNEYVLFVLL